MRKICSKAGGRLCSEAQDTGCVRTDDRFTACSSRHSNNYACESRDGSQQFCDAVHQHHSRRPTVSYCMPSPMERSSALDQRHTSPGYDAQFHEFPGLYRNTDEGIWRGHSHQRSVFWHHQHSQRKDQCSTGIPSHHCRVAAEFLLEWRPTYEELIVYLETARENTRPGGYEWTALSSLHFVAHVPARRPER